MNSRVNKFKVFNYYRIKFELIKLIAKSKLISKHSVFKYYKSMTSSVNKFKVFNCYYIKLELIKLIAISKHIFINY